ncbi:unnamed protein product [Ilex paraguariensis]|uniref:Uncharacterized protein n=1 Tax=Ilex paraguariensis TaxID=185542 RepID=A0ABC8QQH8_9AQUA
MSKLTEITNLFASLASNLETLDETATSESQSTDLSISISNLTQSLNLTPTSRVKVLDTALSLMCFTAPQVLNSMNEDLVKTIITALSSSIGCMVLRFGKEEVLRVGGSISSQDCVEVVQACSDVLGRCHGVLSRSLLYAVARVAISASRFRYALQLTPILDLKSMVGRTPEFSKLLCHLPKENTLKSREIPLRGLASVLELQTELVSWTLTGPLYCQSFLLLLRNISKAAPHTKRHSDPTPRQAGTKITMVNHISMWALAMNFPDWFFFASVLLFSRKSIQDNFHSQCTFGASKAEQSHNVTPPCTVAAARYIAWILNPISESQQDLLIDCLTKLSGSSNLEQLGSDKCETATSGYKKEFKKHKFHGKEDHISLEQRILVWLKIFQDMYVTYCKRAIYSSASTEVKTSLGLGLQQNALFRRISLGFLLGNYNRLNEEGCEILLHYAATGTIYPTTEIQNTGLKHKRWHSEREDELITRTNIYDEKEAVAGACLVFHFTDTIENMSASIFETEENGVDFICQVKSKAGYYLLKCVKRLLQPKTDEIEGHLILRDLYDRLVRWRHQGQDVFHGNNDTDDAIAALSNKLHSS